jgi:hypothetical protein
MGTFVKGDVVVFPFSFSDLSAAKRRPALVVATLTGDDVILCQITSRSVADSYAIPSRIATSHPGDSAKTVTCVRTAYSRRIPTSFYIEPVHRAPVKCRKSLPRLSKSSAREGSYLAE